MPFDDGTVQPLRIGVIVPFHRNLGQLEQCLGAIRSAAGVMPSRTVLAEMLVVADGAVDDPLTVASKWGARVLAIAGPRGPAAARTEGAATMSCDVLVFVDTDVVVEKEAIGRLARLFVAEPDLAAAFGAYDEAPADPGFVSQCRNLAHSYIHQRSNREAQTFWAGLGAMRADVFAAVGGFDERFARPSVEDIDLGYRVREAGRRIVLDPTIQGKHLKRWTFRGSVMSDLFDRGIPWTQLLHRYTALNNDLNVSRAYRICVVVSYLAVLFTLGAVWSPLTLLGTLACLLTLVVLDWSYYRFFVRQRGVWFTVRWFPLHVLHHLCNGVSFAAGTTLYWASRFGLRLPGSLPVDRWDVRRFSARTMPQSDPL
jgi:GT2 family glycosyltransferase